MLRGLARRVRIEARIGQEMCLRLTARVVASDSHPEPNVENGRGVQEPLRLNVFASGSNTHR